MSRVGHIAEHYIDVTSIGQAEGSKRNRGESYADVSELPLPPELFRSRDNTLGNSPCRTATKLEGKSCPSVSSVHATTEIDSKRQQDTVTSL